MAFAWAIIGVAVGIPLGLRFNVVALIFAITLAVMFALIVGIARGESFGSIALAVVTVGIAIKLGYFAGILGETHPVAGSSDVRGEDPRGMSGQPPLCDTRNL